MPITQSQKEDDQVFTGVDGGSSTVAELELREILSQVLTELRVMNVHLSMITDVNEELKEFVDEN